MKNQIPAPVIAVLSELAAEAETHPSLNSLFMYADAYGDAPEGSKPVKVQAWLRTTNKMHADPLQVLGKIIEGYMDDPEMTSDEEPNNWMPESESHKRKRELVRKLEVTLGRSNLKYISGGHITTGAQAPSKKLSELIHVKDVAAIHREFERAMETLDSKPREAVSAASNILESIFKVYIEDNNLTMPDKQDLQPVFKVVRAHLGLDPSSVEDQDIQRIISGLFSVVDGIGALRTHAGSAHSEGRKGYRLEPRHARLAVNSAHTVATFVLETWISKRPWTTSMGHQGR